MLGFVSLTFLLLYIYQLVFFGHLLGSYHIHPEKGAMVGPLHVATPHDYLDPFIEQDNETSSIINQTTIQSTSRSSTSSGTSSGTSGSSY